MLTTSLWSSVLYQCDCIISLFENHSSTWNANCHSAFKNAVKEFPKTGHKLRQAVTVHRKTMLKHLTDSISSLNFVFIGHFNVAKCVGSIEFFLSLQRKKSLFLSGSVIFCVLLCIPYFTTCKEDKQENHIKTVRWFGYSCVFVSQSLVFWITEPIIIWSKPSKWR